MRVKLLTAVLALLAGVPETLPARAAAPAATVVPIQVTGPGSSRFNLVVRGETTAANRQILAIGNSDTCGGAGGTYATAEGIVIEQQVYGELDVPRVVPWDDVPPGYGRHQVEYRAIDATGNIVAPRRPTWRPRTGSPDHAPGSARSSEAPAEPR